MLLPLTYAAVPAKYRGRDLVHDSYLTTFSVWSRYPDNLQLCPAHREIESNT